MLEILHNLEQKGINSSNFEYAFDENFTAIDSNGQRVELILGGAGIKVTFENAK